MKNCTKCGAVLEDNAVFCGKCGASFADQAVQSMGFQQPQFNQPQPQQPQFQQPQFQQPQQQFNQPQPQQFQQPQQQFNQPQPFGQPQYAQPGFQGGTGVKQGSNKALIFVIIGVVVAAIVCVILFLFVFKSDYKKDIVGTWVDKTDSTSSITFEDGGTLKMVLRGITLKGTYKISGKELTMTYSFMGVSNSETYEIVKLNGSTMRLKDKKDSSLSELTKK